MKPFAKLSVVESALWAGVLAVVDGLPKETCGTARSIGEFTHDGNGGTTANATYEVSQPDGSAKVYALTLTVQASTSDQDWFWGPGGHRDDDDPAKRVVVEGEHYLIGDETPGNGMRGFGGRRIEIEFFDGRTATTRNLWHQGLIPPRWRERFPDNARFVTPGGEA